jgi:hypothetical protein
MSDACTLICPKKACGAALDALRGASPCKVKVSGNRNRWKTAKVLFPTSTLKFTTPVRRRRGDSFSKLVLSMYAFFDGANTKAKKKKSMVLEAIANTRMFIGVVAEPELNEGGEHLTCILAIARQLDALLFDGKAMHDAQGRRLLRRGQAR